MGINVKTELVNFVYCNVMLLCVKMRTNSQLHSEQLFALLYRDAASAMMMMMMVVMEFNYGSDQMDKIDLFFLFSSAFRLLSCHTLINE